MARRPCKPVVLLSILLLLSGGSWRLAIAATRAGGGHGVDVTMAKGGAGPDSDGDGIPDAVEGTADTDGDA